MTPSSTRPAPDHPSNNIGRRATGWLFLALVGNVLVLAAPFTLVLSPIGVRWNDFATAVGPFVLPVYSPTLLLFSLILTILERAGSSGSVDPADEAEARYLIANSIRIALVIALSFGVLMVLLQPNAVALVLFAALVSFIAIVRAEIMAPPRNRKPEDVYRRAQATQFAAERSATLALGQRWTTLTIAEHPALTVALLFAVPIALPGAAIVIVGAMMWGPGLALSANFIVMSFVLMFGPAMLVLAWLAAADKSDSRRARAWRVGFLVTMSLAATVSLSSVFLFSGRNWAWLGFVVLASAMLTALALWSPRPVWLHERRQRLQRRWTKARIERLANWTSAAETEWSKRRVPPPLVVRVLAHIIRPFRRAYRLAEQDD